LVVLREALKENEMQTLEALTKKDRCAIAALVEQSRAIGFVTDLVSQWERAEIVRKIARILKIPIGTGTRGVSKWNATVLWLDSNHSEWRGYQVDYPIGGLPISALAD